jgi:hypothetical protein
MARSLTDSTNSARNGTWETNNEPLDGLKRRDRIGPTEIHLFDSANVNARIAGRKVWLETKGGVKHLTSNGCLSQ